MHEIYPDSCIDEHNKVGTKYNDNGITWIKEYCQNALPTIKGMSLKCEFLDDERTELQGHGETGSDIDGLPLFENATVIGTFDNGYIKEIDTNNGRIIVCIGEGTIDGLCYHNFVEKLEKDILCNNAPNGSVEILRTGDNPSIIYKYGDKGNGRIPMIFEYSGYALLGVRPADFTSKILELNNKEESKMDKLEMRKLVAEILDEINERQTEISKISEAFEKKIAEIQACVSEKEQKIEELNACVSSTKEELNACKNERNALMAKNQENEKEINSLKEQLNAVSKLEKIRKLDDILSPFSDEEKKYAESEISAFKEDPIKCEQNEVGIAHIIRKIYEEIGKRAKSFGTREVNSLSYDIDIFGEIESKPTKEVISIF